MRFQNRTILVTGGTSGIGFAAARAFLAEGANVVMAASGRIRGERAESMLREEYGERVRFFPCDVRKEEEICKLMEFVEVTFGGLDTLCNNAGVSIRGRAEEMCVADWDTVLEVNLRGAFLCAKYALPLLRKSRGTIVNTISELGFVATKGCIAYLCSKGGLLQLTRGLALEFAEYGVRVNAVCPAGTDTPMFRADMGSGEAYEKNVAALAASYPLGRIAVPEDIAPAVLFLAGEDSAFMTGQYILLDGGFTLQ